MEQERGQETPRRRQQPEEGSLEADLVRRAQPDENSLEAELLRSAAVTGHSSASFTSDELRHGRKEAASRSPDTEKEISFAAVEERQRGRKLDVGSPEIGFTSEELRLSRKGLEQDPEISFALGEKALLALARVPAPRELLTDLEDWERLSVLCPSSRDSDHSVLEEKTRPPEKEVVRRRGPPPGETRLIILYFTEGRSCGRVGSDNCQSFVS